MPGATSSIRATGLVKLASFFRRSSRIAKVFLKSPRGTPRSCLELINSLDKLIDVRELCDYEFFFKLGQKFGETTIRILGFAITNIHAIQPLPICFEQQGRIELPA